MSVRRKIETEFYMFTKIAGIQQVKSNKFIFEDNDYTVHAIVSPEIAASLGGRNRAFRLLRHAEIIEFICATLGRDHVFGVVGRSFDQVSREHPFLRSSYEAARVGGFAGAWVE